MFYNTLERSMVLLLCLVYGSKVTVCDEPVTLDMSTLPTIRIKLSTPPLSEIVEVLVPGLSENFETVSVEIVQCPDLTQPPFNLAAEGLCGNETVVDVGSPSYLLPLADMNKVYDIRDLNKLTGTDPLFAVGAGAGSWPYVGVNSELIANVRSTCSNVDINRSHFYKINEDNESIGHVEAETDTRFALLANFFTSNGLGGEVLRIECETRTGPLDFITTINKALAKSFGDEIVSLGGVMLIENGKVKIHVMPDFSKTPIDTEVVLNNWLKFFEVSTTYVGHGYLISRDPDLDLRPQHFHLVGEDGSGGHYHYDTEPATIKYTAYLNVAKYLIRVDKPKVASSFGKD